MRLWVFLLTCGALAVACSGAEDNGLLTSNGGDGGGGNDGATNDAGNPGCDVSRCATVPDGFHVVRQSTSACPQGWDTLSGVAAPISAEGACSCNCNITQDPDCNTGNVGRYFD